MKIQSFGVLKSHYIKQYAIGKLDIKEGVTKNYFVKIYKEYIGNELTLKLYLLKDKLGKHLGYRLKHISHNKETLRLDRFI